MIFTEHGGCTALYHSYNHTETLLPCVHLRKMEADTPPLVGFPQTKSTTSLFNSDMTRFNHWHSSVGQPRGHRTARLRPSCQLFPRWIFLFGRVEPVALATRYLCATIQSDYWLAANWRVGMTSTL